MKVLAISVAVVLYVAWFCWSVHAAARPISEAKREEMRRWIRERLGEEAGN